VSHPSAEHVVVDSDTDHGLSDTAADLGQDLPSSDINACQEGRREDRERTLGFW
jgi:hypothetical protein